MRVTDIEHLTYVAEVHLGFEVNRVRLGGELAVQDEISTRFHQIVASPAGHRTLPVPWPRSRMLRWYALGAARNEFMAARFPRGTGYTAAGRGCAPGPARRITGPGTRSAQSASPREPPRGDG